MIIIGINVLSLFDGISCGQVALERAGVEVDNYYASEIDRYAISVTQNNYPKTKQIGNAINIKTEDLSDIDLLIGGSPCQNLSCAGDGTGLSGEKSSLFWEYVRIKNDINPKYFLFENVASMNKKDKDIITEALGVEPIMIDSNMFSAQNRKRYYWTNIIIEQLPYTSNIMLKDILINRNELNENVWHTDKAKEYMLRPIKGGKIRLYNGQGVTFEKQHKSSTITANYYKGVPYNVFVYEDMNMRKFTPEECEVLQTLPIGYTNNISNTQRYKSIGNGWTVDVIAHILKGIKT